MFPILVTPMFYPPKKCRTFLLVTLALTLGTACGHPPTPSVDVPAVEEPPAETLVPEEQPGEEPIAEQASPSSNPACEAAVACGFVYRSGNFPVRSPRQLGEIRDCRNIPGSLNVFTNGNWLTDVDLPCLTSIGSDLFITQNRALSGLDGLSNLTSVGGNLVITENRMLSSLDGLSNLTSVGRNVIIRGNPALPSFDDFESLRTYLRAQPRPR